MMECNELHASELGKISEISDVRIREATREFIETTESIMRLLGSIGRMLDRLAILVPYMNLKSKIEKHQQRSAVHAQTEKQQRSVIQTQTVLDFASLILPRKITDECFGDLLESLNEMVDTIPPWRLQLQALISVGWAFIFTLRELAKPGALLVAIWKLMFD